MSLLLLALAVAQAEAAVPIRLPPQERAADWQEALSIAGLSVGVPGDGPWVDVVAGPTSWTVRVRDLAGVVHDASVPPPRSDQEREDMAMLAASLLQPVVVPKPVKPPPPTPVRTTPKPTPVTPPPEPPPPEPEPPAPEPEPVVVVPVPEPPPPPTFQGRVGLAGEIRPWSTPTALAWGEVQYVGASPLRPALGGALSAPAEIVRVDEEVRYWSGEAWVGAWYAASAPVRFDFGLTAGIAARTFLQADTDPLPAAWIPVLSTRLELPLTVAPGLVVEPGAHLQIDAREVWFRNHDDSEVRFGDWSVRASVALRPIPRIPTNP